MSKSRAAAAAKNTCRTLSKYSNIFDNMNISEEMKQARIASEQILDDEDVCVVCGTTNPAKRFLGCPEHLSCENCCEYTDMLRGKDDLCSVRGCKHSVVFPAVHLVAYDGIVRKTRQAVHLFDAALQHDSAKDSEGEFRRQEILAERRAKREKKVETEGGEDELASIERKLLNEEDEEEGEGEEKTVYEKEEPEVLQDRDPDDEEEEEEKKPEPEPEHKRAPKRKKADVIAEFGQEAWDEMQSKRKRAAQANKDKKARAVRLQAIEAEYGGSFENDLGRLRSLCKTYGDNLEAKLTDAEKIERIREARNKYKKGYMLMHDLLQSKFGVDNKELEEMLKAALTEAP
tara:strand:- start:326 stop:1360 length:1035 start_codon:yes stop_codon:yes gene_type:complete